MSNIIDRAKCGNVLTEEEIKLLDEIRSNPKHPHYIELWLANLV